MGTAEQNFGVSNVPNDLYERKYSEEAAETDREAACMYMRPPVRYVNVRETRTCINREKKNSRV